MTKREWINNRFGNGILAGMDDDCINFFYKATHDCGMSFGDSDRWAWINTLFSYDVGAENALAIMRFCDAKETDILEFGADDVCMLKESGLNLDYSKCRHDTPEYIEYEWG